MGETEYDHRPYEFCRKCHNKIPAEDKHCSVCEDDDLDAKVKLIHGDCIDEMSKLDSNYIDLTVTSPPYDNLRSYNNQDGFTFDVFKKVANGLFKVTKKGGVVVWVVGDATIKGSETGTSFRQALYFKSIGFNLHDTMILLKKNPIPQIFRKRYTNVFEFMFILSKGYPKTCNPIMTPCLHAKKEMNGTTYKNYSKGKQSRKKQARPVKDTKIRGNLWSYVVGKNKGDQEAKGHPAPFPELLAHDHILSWSNAGDTVLDPMMGSGTTGKMAKQLNRNFIGIEKDKTYYDIAVKRISES